VVGLLLAVALVAAACGDDDDAGTTTTAAETTTTAAETTTTAAETTTTAAETTTTTEAETTTTTEAPAELVLGYLLPQSGALAPIIDALAKPIEMAVAEITDAGGVVSLIPGDSGTDPNVATVTADALLNAEVDAIVGAAASGVSLSVIDRITGSNVPMCSPSNTAATFSTYDDGGFYFRTAPSDVLQGPALADAMTAGGATSAAILYRNDEYGAGFAGFLGEALEANGVTVVESIAYDPNATTFDAEAGQVAAAGVDSVAIITFAEGAPLLQGMIEAGVGPQDLSIWVADGFKDTVQAVDVDPNNPGVLEGVRGTAPSSAPPTGEATFGERLEDFAPGTPTIFSAFAYDCAMVFALSAAVAGSTDSTAIAAEMVGVTRDGEKCSSYADCLALIEAGTDIDYDGASGPLEFTDVGEPSAAVYDVYEYDAEGNAVTYEQVEIS
jgi:branched-chain amino acid transport system substrate-binding protein